MSAPAVKEARRSRPLTSRVLLEIPRTPRSILRVELVTWDPLRGPCVRLVSLALGSNGWFVLPTRTAIRLEECQRVAQVLMEVAE